MTSITLNAQTQAAIELARTAGPGLNELSPNLGDGRGQAAAV